MSHPTLILLVRFKSKLPFPDVMEIVEERAPEFEALSGLTQKYYVHDPVSGEVGGLYLWDSKQAFDDYRQSALRATIAEAYQAVDEPRIEVYDVVKVLRQ